MKKHQIYPLVGMMALLGILAIINRKQAAEVSTQIPTEQINNDSLVGLEKLPVRESITFIMGEDGEANNPYYTEAENYYRFNETDRTEYTVTSCRSLLDVKEYLEMYIPENDRPWGRINIVVHSNEWSDMGVAIFPDGERATESALKYVLENDGFPGLRDEVVDSQTEMVVHGCGLGKNAEILKLLSLAFGGKKDAERPIVRSSRYFVFYESEKYDGMPMNPQRYLSEYWYAFYKTGYRPGDIRLSRQLNTLNPEAEVNWRDALTRTQPRFIGDSYHHTFWVPVVWYVTYPSKSDRPDLNSEEAKQQWLNEQPELLAAIEGYGIDRENFKWTFRKTTYEFEDGTKEPAIKAIGLCTVLTVLQAITDPNSEEPKPFIPELTDEQYYAVENPNVEQVIAQQ